MTKKQATTISLLSVAAILLGLLISRRLWFRLDLTQDHSHTLSAASRNLRDEIPSGDQVILTYYVSDKLASLHPMPGEIEDLLRDYTSYSRGTIRLVLRDPVKANMAADVERLGIIPQQVQTVEQDQSSIATVYTGIVIEYLEQIDVLPVVFSLDTLEYDITSRIRSLVRGTERQAGVIVGDSYRQWENHYLPLAQALYQSGYRTRLLNAGDEIPPSLPVLLVLGGVEDLDEWSLYRIDYYIRNGGRVFFALDAVYVDTEGSLEGRVMEDKGLLAMVSFYGATLLPELVLERNARTLQYYIQDPNGTVIPRVVRYPHWFGVLGENVSKIHPLTKSFSGLDLFWPSPISLNLPSGVEGEILFTSTPQAWLQRDSFITNPELGGQMEGPTTGEPQILGVSLTGYFPFWFQGVPKPVREGSTEELPDLGTSSAPSRIIVVGDADVASDLTDFTGADYNLDFLLKALDWLGNDDELVEIRSRASWIGRLDKEDDPIRKERAMGFAQTLNVVLLPLAIIGAGLLFAWKRKERNAEGRGNAL